MIPSNKQDLTPALQKLVPFRVRQQLLFLDDQDWGEPPHFTMMSGEEKAKVYNLKQKLSTFPTISNQWVWFGSYTAPIYKPVYNTKRVAKILYEALISPMGAARLTNAFVKYESDVNPYKYSSPATMPDPSVLQGLSTVTKAVKVDKKLEKITKKLERDFTDYEIQEICNGNGDEMFKMLSQLGYAPLMIINFLTEKGFQVTRS